MTGKELKAKLKASNVPFNTIAERLGVAPQTLNSYFNVQDVRSNTIERLSTALGVDMSFFYPSAGKSINANNGGVAFTGGSNNGAITTNGASEEEVNALKGQAQALERIIKEKETIIQEKERLIQLLLNKLN